MTEALLPELWQSLAGRFELVRELDHGPRTLAFVVRDDVGRELVLKVPHPALASTLRISPKALLRELEVVSRLKHPNILPILAFGEAAGHVYYCLPYVSGGTLAERLARQSLDLESTRVIAEAIGEALAYAKGFGVIHRGLGPAQVIFDGDRPLVREFGVDRLLAFHGDRLQTPALTASGLQIGTPDFMSPEELAGERVDHRTDIYALAVLTVFMLTRRLPFEGSSVQDVLVRRLLAEAPSDADLPRALPTAVRAAVRRAMARDPAARFADVRAFVAALGGPALGVSVALLAPPAPAAASRVPAAQGAEAPDRGPDVTDTTGLGSTAKGLARRLSSDARVVILIGFGLGVLAVAGSVDPDATSTRVVLVSLSVLLFVLAGMRLARRPVLNARTAPTELVERSQLPRAEDTPDAVPSRYARRARQRSDATARLRDALAFQYEIIRPLGSGGMAQVFLARDLRYRDRQIALKVLRAEHLDSDVTERFLDEIDIVAGLSHPNILPLLDSGDVEGQPYFVMPFVEGSTLRDALERTPVLTVSRTIEIALPVARALEYAHGRGVVHRDVKPENVLLHGGQAMLADFGIALALDTVTDRRRTNGRSIGTPPYMSPEQFWDTDHIGAAADQYSVGCMLFEMLTGSTPFIGETHMELAMRHRDDPIPALAARRPGVPMDIDRCVTRLLQKRPDDRFPGMAAFSRELATLERSLDSADAQRP